MATRKKVVPVQTALTVDDVSRWSDKFEGAIDKLTSATTDMAVGVSAHTARLDQMDKQDAERETEYKDLAERQRQDSEKLSTRITEVQLDLTKSMNDQTTRLEATVDTAVVGLKNHITDSNKTMNDRVSSLEKWRWGIAGGAAVVMVILSAVLFKILGIILEKVGWTKFLGF